MVDELNWSYQPVPISFVDAATVARKALEAPDHFPCAHGDTPDADLERRSVQRSAEEDICCPVGT